jgi:iron(III) transport system permease protein
VSQLARSPLYVALLAAGALFFAAGVLAPLGSIVVQAVFPGGSFSTSALEAALGEARVWTLLGRTVWLGTVTAAIAGLIGVPYAWLLARTDLPLRELWRALGLAPVVIPPLLLSIAWSGWMPWLEGIWANAFVFSLAYAPIVILLASRAFEQIDGERLDAARLLGGERAALRIALGLAWPQIAIALLLVFVFTTSDFAVPDYIAAMQSVERQQLSFNVYAGEIFAWIKLGTRYAEGAAASLPLAAIIFGALALVVRQLRRIEVATVGSGFRGGPPVRLGRWMPLALLGILTYLALAFFLPIVRFVSEMQHVNPLLRAMGLSPDGSPDQNLSPAFLQSLKLSASGATVAVLASLAFAHFAARRRKTLWLDLLWITPLAFPGIAYGIGMVGFYSTHVELFRPIRNGSAALIINLAGHFLPFAYFAIQGAVRRTEREQEDAALLCGARPGVVFTRISLPLLARGLVAGWLLCFLFAMREIDSFALLSYGESTIMRRIYEFIHRGRSPEIAAGCLVLIFFIAVPLALHALLGKKKVEVL